MGDSFHNKNITKHSQKQTYGAITVMMSAKGAFAKYTPGAYQSTVYEGIVSIEKIEIDGKEYRNIDQNGNPLADPDFVIPGQFDKIPEHHPNYIAKARKLVKLPGKTATFEKELNIFSHYHWLNGNEKNIKPDSKMYIWCKGFKHIHSRNLYVRNEEFTVQSGDVQRLDLEGITDITELRIGNKDYKLGYDLELVDLPKEFNLTEIPHDPDPTNRKVTPQNIETLIHKGFRFLGSKPADGTKGRIDYKGFTKLNHVLYKLKNKKVDIKKKSQIPFPVPGMVYWTSMDFNGKVYKYEEGEFEPNDNMTIGYIVFPRGMDNTNTIDAVCKPLIKEGTWHDPATSPVPGDNVLISGHGVIDKTIPVVGASEKKRSKGGTVKKMRRQ